MKDIYFESIEIKNFKLCKDTKITLSGNLTALLGKNGAGKTTLLQAVELLHSSTQSEVHQYNYHSKPVKKDFDITTVKANIYMKGRYYTFVLDAYFRKDEITSRPTTSMYKLVDHEANKTFDYHDFDFILTYSDIKFRQGTGISGNIVNKIDSNTAQSMIDVLEFVREITYIETSDFLNSSKNNTTIEVGGRMGHGMYRGSRENAMFLKELYELSVNAPLDFKKYKNIVSRVGGGLVSGVDFEPLQLPKSSVQLYKNGKLSTVEETRELIVPIFTIGKNKLYNNQLSEGTFRALALVYYILNSNSSLVILEEPELSVHYELLADLIGLIGDSAKRNQVVISTHSERIVDLLAIKDIVMVRRGDNGVTSNPLMEILTKDDLSVLEHFMDNGGGLSNFISSDL